MPAFFAFALRKNKINCITNKWHEVIKKKQFIYKKRNVSRRSLMQTRIAVEHVSCDQMTYYNLMMIQP